MMKKTKLKTKVCSRCKKDQPLTNFKNEIRDRISGKFLWIYPMCNDCSFEIKTKWGTNWTGGTNGVGEKQKEDKHNISSKSRRRTNKKVHIQRIERTISESNIEEHNDSLPTFGKQSVRQRDNILPNKCGPGRIIKTLQKTKDYKESV